MTVPFLDLEREYEQRRQQRARTALEQAQATPAPVARQQAEAARAAGLPLEAGPSLPAPAPAIPDGPLATWLGSLPNAAQVHDDLPAIGSLAELVRRAPAQEPAMLRKIADVTAASADIQTRIASRGFDAVLRGISDADLRTLGEDYDRVLRRQDEAGAGLPGVVRSAAVVAPSMAQGLAANARGAAIGGTLGGIIGGLAGSPTGPGAAVTAGGGAAAGAVIGATIEGWINTFKTEAGLEYLAQRRARTADGQPVSHARAALVALGTGFINATVETVSDALTLGLTPAAGAARRALRLPTPEPTKVALRAALERPTTAAALRSAGGKYVKAIGVEAAEEAVQSLPAGIANVMGGVLDADERPYTMGDVGRDAWDSALEAGKAMTILGLPFPLMDASARMARASRAAAARDRFQAIHEAALSSTTRAEAPETVAEMVRSVAPDAPAVWVDASAFATFFQASGVAPEVAAAEVLGGDAAPFLAADQTGGRFAIPMDRFASRVAGTPLYDALREDMAAAADALTPREATALTRDLTPEGIDALVRSLAAESVPVEGDQRVYEDVLAQAVAAGVPTAQAEGVAELHRLIYRSLAARSGQTVDALRAQRDVRIVGGATAARVLARPDLYDAARTPDGRLRSDAALRLVPTRVLVRELQAALTANQQDRVTMLGRITTDNVAQGYDNELVVGSEATMRAGGRVQARQRAIARIERALATRGLDDAAVAGLMADLAAEDAAAQAVADEAERAAATDAQGMTWEEIAALEDDADLVDGQLVDEDGNVLFQSDMPDTIDVDGTPRSTRNSEGRPIAATEDAVRAFWRWFGDSKVVDEQGRPQVVYHGTRADFDTFDAARLGEATGAPSAALGFFFTDTVSGEARGWMATGAEVWAADRAGSYAGGGNIVPVYVRAVSPRTVSFREMSAAHSDEAAARLLRERAIADGHDALAFREGDEQWTIVFDARQVKSSIGNVGTFDPANPSILFQEPIGDPAAGQRLQLTGGTERNGFIQFSPDKHTVTIGLLSKANPSTFLHESAHLFLEMLADAATQAGASESLVADVAALRAWLGNEGGPRGTMPVAPGMVRMYHGGALGVDGPRWLSPDRSYAEGYARKSGGVVQFVDLPVGDARLVKAFDDEGTGMVAPFVAFEADADLAARLQPFVEPTRNAGTSPFTRDQHEQFARAFERYVGEGRVPAPGLRGLFARFRSWITGVYRDLTGLGVPLTDEVRGIFDRLIAGEQAMGEAMAQANAGATFTTQAQSGLGDAEWAAYQAQATEAEEAALTRLTGALLAEQARERTAWWRGERDARVAAVTAALAEQPVWRAVAALREEGLPSQWVADFYGTGVRQQLARRKLTSKDGGVDPATLALEVGFASADEMVAAVLAVRGTVEQAAQRQVAADMAAEYGNYLNDSAALAAAAQRALHDEGEAPMLALYVRELAALGGVRGLVPGQTAATVVAALRRSAAAQVGATRVMDLPGAVRGWLTAERKAAREVETRLARGDRAGAAEAKRRQMLAHLLVREGTAASARAETQRRAVAKAGTLPWRQRVGKASQEWLAQLDHVLESVDLKVRSRADAGGRQAFAQFAARMAAEGKPIILPPEGLPAAPWQTLTIQQAQDVHDAVQSIVTRARQENQLTALGRRETVDEARTLLADALRATGRTAPQDGDAMAPGTSRRRRFREAVATLRTLPSLIREFNRGEEMGAWWDIVLRPLRDAATTEATRLAEAAAALRPIMALLEPDARAMGRADYTVRPGLTLTLRQRLAVVLNMGTETNLQRLRDGNGFSDAELTAIRESLTDTQLQWVQAVWDFLDSFWPETRAVAERLDGVAPEKVEAIPFVVRGRQYRGGYYRIKYDPSSFKRQEEVDAQQYALGAAFRGTTKNGARNERMASTDYKLRLDLNVLTEHVSETVHDITHALVVQDVNTVLRGDEIREAAVTTIGKELYDQIGAALQDVARNGRPMEPSGAIAEVMVRHISLVGMGFNVMTAALQPTGFLPAAQRIGWRWVARGIATTFRSPAAARDAAALVAEKSAFMADRLRSTDRTPSQVIDEFVQTEGIPRAQRWMAEQAFAGIRYMQAMVDVPTWIGAYQKALGTSDEATAIRIADAAVADSQGSKLLVDQAQVMRLRGWAKVWVAMYSYMNTMYNALIAEGRIALQGGTRVEQVAAMTQAAFLYVILPTLAAKLLRDLARGEEDEGAGDYALETLAGFFNLVPLGREVAGAFSGFTDYDGPAGARLFASIGKLTRQVQRWAETGEVGTPTLRAVNETAGLVFGYPATQLDRTVRGIAALVQGETRNPAVILTGPARATTR